ncbi:MAG: glutathione peroxidase [Crocinitomicaceae bacterium]|nr:glutathione peroxidase [Crocinitomicaceae bacterium]
MGIFDIFTKIPIIDTPQKPIENLHDNTIKLLDGNEISLSKFKGKKILFVNVASKCGFTNQYADLQKLYEENSDKLEIIGLPCNQFGYQEKGNASEIQNFCSVNYGVTFPITEKIKVKGSEQHPIYDWLTSKNKNGTTNSRIKWNFQKYLVNEEGELQAIFSSKSVPFSDELLTAINS